MGSFELPPEWKAKPPSKVDLLLWFRADPRPPQRLYMNVGSIDPRIFQAFLDGFAFAAYARGSDEEEDSDFLRWLADIGVHTHDGAWWETLRRLTETDLAAIQALLQFAYEFRRARATEGT